MSARPAAVVGVEKGDARRRHIQRVTGGCAAQRKQLTGATGRDATYPAEPAAAETLEPTATGLDFFWRRRAGQIRIQRINAHVDDFMLVSLSDNQRSFC